MKIHAVKEGNAIVMSLKGRLDAVASSEFARHGALRPNAHRIRVRTMRFGNSSCPAATPDCGAETDLHLSWFDLPKLRQFLWSQALRPYAFWGESSWRCLWDGSPDDDENTLWSNDPSSALRFRPLGPTSPTRLYHCQKSGLLGRMPCAAHQPRRIRRLRPPVFVLALHTRYIP